MFEAARCRRARVVVEACHGGHDYHPCLRAWLADECHGGESSRALYEHINHQVAGSDVSVYHVAGGDLDDVSRDEFPAP